MSATGRGTKRNERDFYPTPRWCTEALLPLIKWNNVNSFFVPCLGEGAIYNLIPMDNKDWSEIEKGGTI